MKGGDNRRIGLIVLGGIATAALVVLGVLALAHGTGADSTTGKVASIVTDGNGKRICVAGNDGKVCGTAYPSDIRLVTTLKLGQCVYIKAERDAALDLERRVCH